MCVTLLSITTGWSLFHYRPLECGVKVIAAHCATEVFLICTSSALLCEATFHM